jgi:L-ribulose-5-phosphate 4-epimerase
MIKKLIEVNQSLIKEGLVIFTWGNASARSADGVSIYIKPSGVPFNKLTRAGMSQVLLRTGTHVSGLKPSVDTPTHIELYNAFPEANSVIHTHSKYCTIFAQAKMPIPCLGTTHADYFYGPIPVVDELSPKEIEEEYEKNIGLKIVNYFKENNISPDAVKAALSPSHGVFVWGSSLDEALKNAIVLENVAEMAYKTLSLCYNEPISCDLNLLRKHFLRKNGEKKYYGQ